MNGGCGQARAHYIGESHLGGQTILPRMNSLSVSNCVHLRQIADRRSSCTLGGAVASVEVS